MSFQMTPETGHYEDLDDLPRYGRKWVGGCTCGTWDHLHETNCGWDIDDEVEL